MGVSPPHPARRRTRPNSQETRRHAPPSSHCERGSAPPFADRLSSLSFPPPPPPSAIQLYYRRYTAQQVERAEWKRFPRVQYYYSKILPQNPVSPSPLRLWRYVTPRLTFPFLSVGTEALPNDATATTKPLFHSTFTQLQTPEATTAPSA